MIVEVEHNNTISMPIDHSNKFEKEDRDHLALSSNKPISIEISMESIESNHVHEIQDTFKGIKEVKNCCILFNKLPNDLLHVILQFVACTFREIILFSTLNRTSKKVADYSLCWLNCSLTFYAPREFMVVNGTSVLVTRYSQEYINSLAERTFLPQEILEILSFTTDTNYPPVKKIVIPSPQIITDDDQKEKELNYHLAHRFRQWFLSVLYSYRYYWLLHSKWRPYYLKLYFTISHVIASFDYFLFYSFLSLSFSIYFFHHFPPNTKLSFFNHLGFICIYYAIGFYLLFSLLKILHASLEKTLSQITTMKTLFRFAIGDWNNLIFFLQTTSIFMTVIFGHCKLSGWLWFEKFSWVSLLLPMWMSYLGILVCLFQSYSWQFAIGIALFIQCIPTSCTTAAYYYDHQYRHLPDGIMNEEETTNTLRYTLIPLSPILLGCLIYFLMNFYMMLKYFLAIGGSKKRTNYYGFHSTFHQNIVRFIASCSSTFFALIMSTAAMILGISCFINHEFFEISFLGLQLSPLVLSLIVINSFQCSLYFFFFHYWLE